MIGIVVGIVGAVLALIGVVVALHPKRLSHEPLPLPSRLPRIRIWRSKSFRYGLYLIDQYKKAILSYDSMASQEAGGQGYDLEDLRRWAYQVVLSCAASMVADSQSKSALYRFTLAGNKTPAKLGTFEFAGNVPLSQIADGTLFREIGHSFGDPHGLLKIFEQGVVQLVRLNEQDLNANEDALGTTHLLVIPIANSMFVAEPGTVAGLTVDLRMDWFRRWLYHLRGFFKRSQLRKRGDALQKSVRELVAALVAAWFGQ